MDCLFHRRGLLILVTMALAACGTGTLTSPHTDASSDSDVPRDSAADASPDGSPDAATPLDRCATVVCGHPSEVCDPRTGACVAGAADDDNDGFTIAQGDCNDSEASIHPGADEICDGVDQDCDLAPDDGLIVHGGWSGWSDWSACSAPCGGGTQSRSRSCTAPEPACNGDPCDGEPTASQECNTGSCITDCLYDSSDEGGLLHCNRNENPVAEEVFHDRPSCWTFCLDRAETAGIQGQACCNYFGTQRLCALFSPVATSDSPLTWTRMMTCW